MTKTDSVQWRQFENSVRKWTDKFLLSNVLEALNAGQGLVWQCKVQEQNCFINAWMWANITSSFLTLVFPWWYHLSGAISAWLSTVQNKTDMKITRPTCPNSMSNFIYNFFLKTLRGKLSFSHHCGLHWRSRWFKLYFLMVMTTKQL